jgi:hypothetical protein
VEKNKAEIRIDDAPNEPICLKITNNMIKRTRKICKKYQKVSPIM